MKSRPVTVTNTNGTSTPAKRTLFRIALAVALVGTLALATILLLQGGFALARLRNFIDIGLHPLYITAILLLTFGLLSLISLIVLIIGLVKTKRTFAIVAAALLGVCSVGLIAYSIWSFLTITGGHLSTSISSTITKELDLTQYNTVLLSNNAIENTNKMARLEKQHNCCGHTDPLEDYRSRQSSPPSSGSSSSGSGSSPGKGKPATPRNTAAHANIVHLPISCCNEKYRTTDNLCVDTSGNTTNPLNRYNTEGCYAVIGRSKFERIQRQGFTTIVAACLAVISCIALVAVVRLLGEGYQIVPLRSTT